MSTPSSTISLAERRSWAYWFVDGLPQLLIGVSSLLFGFYFITSGNRHTSHTASILGLVGFLIYLFLLVRGTQILEWLKERITYPRTGYAASPYFAEKSNLACVAELNLSPLHGGDASLTAELKEARDERTRHLVLTYFLIACGCLAMWLIHAPWVCAVTGLLTGFLLWLATRTDARLSWIIVLGFPLLGFGMTALQIAPRQRVNVFIFGAGFLFLLEGLVALLLYLRRNPVARTSEE